MEQRLEIRILGPLEGTDGIGVVELGGLRQRALLAHLAVAANRVVPADALIDDLSSTVQPWRSSRASSSSRRTTTTMTSWTGPSSLGFRTWAVPPTD